MRQILCLMLVSLLVCQLVPVASGADTVSGQITGMPTGTKIEILLTNKQKLRGARGEVSDTGFTLLNPDTGNRQIAFSDVTSVKVTKKSHTTRNVLIVVGIAVVVVVAVLAIHIKNCPLGCNSGSGSI